MEVSEGRHHRRRHLDGDPRGQDGIRGDRWRVLGLAPGALAATRPTVLLRLPCLLLLRCLIARHFKWFRSLIRQPPEIAGATSRYGFSAKERFANHEKTPTISKRAVRSVRQSKPSIWRKSTTSLGCRTRPKTLVTFGLPHPVRSVSPEQPIFSAIEWIAAHCEACSPWRSSGRTQS
jgi:hypothetical protein